jgi:hypothetical protein
MSFNSQAKRMVGFCWVAGALLGLGVQPQAQTTMPPVAGSRDAPNDKQKQVARKSVTVEVLAVNYYSRGGEGKIEFSPTALMPGATGQGQVKILKDGSVSVELQFSGLDSAAKFGNQFLTYVLWGSVPKGRTLNIAELTLTGDRGGVVATTVLRTFAMLVTAEPYAVVTQPSSNVILKGTSLTGDTSQTGTAQVDLLDNAYGPPGCNYEPLDTSSGYAPELIQAINARRIAKTLNAEKYAPVKFRQAEDFYHYMIGSAKLEKKPSKDLLKTAKSVAQSYEEARAISIRMQQNRK